MHIPIPFAGLAQRFRRAYSYFRTGVVVEGRACLCDTEHQMFWVLGAPSRKVPQHVDVELKFWNGRNERITILEVARAARL